MGGASGGSFWGWKDVVGSIERSAFIGQANQIPGNLVEV